MTMPDAWPMSSGVYSFDFWVPTSAVILLLLDTIICHEQEGIVAAFFKSFRKGFVVYRGLDVNLSGKVAKKNDSDTEKRSPCPQCVPPLAIAAYEICHGVTEHG